MNKIAKPTVLVVDDRRTFAFPARYARTAAAGLSALARGQVYDEIWLDHDLGQSPRDIWPVVELLERLARRDARPVRGWIIVCSDNPVGAERMTLALERSGYRVCRRDARSYLAPESSAAP